MLWRIGLILNYCTVICFQKSDLCVWPIPVNPLVSFHFKLKLEVFWKGFWFQKCVWIRDKTRAVADAWEQLWLCWCHQPWSGAWGTWRRWQLLGSALPVSHLAQIHSLATLELPGNFPCWKVAGAAFASLIAVSHCSKMLPVHSWNSRLPTAAALWLQHSVGILPSVLLSWFWQLELIETFSEDVTPSEALNLLKDPFLASEFCPQRWAFSWGQSLPVESWVPSKSFSCSLCSGKSPAHYYQFSSNN